MTCIDLLDMCQGPNYTFYSKHTGKSYIDHCLISANSMNCVSECFVWDRCVENASDHTPITVEITLSSRLVRRQECGFNRNVNWSKLSENDIESRYTVPLGYHIDNILMKCTKCIVVHPDDNMTCNYVF